MDVVYEPNVADHQDLTTSSLRPRCAHKVLDKTIPRFSYVHISSRWATLRPVIQDYATLRNNNAVEALIGYN